MNKIEKLIIANFLNEDQLNAIKDKIQKYEHVRERKYYAHAVYLIEMNKWYIGQATCMSSFT